ncbi:MAG: hypothetical protein ABSC32_08855 [Steroidobacteraceae bacterium]
MNLPGLKTLCACAIVTLWPPALRAQVAASPAPIWPDTFVSRMEALALLETFNAELLTHDSATLTLEHWCDLHRLAEPPRVVADRIRDADKPLSSDQRRELGIGPADAVRYRRVRLKCGPVVLSEADNWYVPGRLTAEMNKLLDTTDIPFGKVVQPLHFQRRTLASKLLWRPLPDGWEMQAAAGGDGTVRLAIPPALLEHRAVLTLPDGTPFSEVIETYTSSILAFPPPRP